jgi:hypothetical protein
MTNLFAGDPTPLDLTRIAVGDHAGLGQRMSNPQRCYMGATDVADA